MSQQLVKKGTNGKHENVMPRSWIEAIKDKNTGQTLVEILQGFNMYFLPYNGNTSSTRCLVPTMLRKKGLWITYVKYDGNVYTEWYATDEIDDKSWGDSSNWRIGNNTLVGDITISSNGNWVINGTETEFKAVGEKGNTPLLRVANNRLQVSYDLGDTYIDVTSNPVYTKFRWLATSGDTQANNVGRIQASTDEGKTWTNMSNDFTNNLHISRYIGINDSLPTSGIAEGTIYAKGPYYAEDDTSNDNPIYRLWVYAWKGNTLAWQDNGEFTSIAAGVVQETGNSETEVMSQKAVSEKLSELASMLSKKLSYSGMVMFGYDGTINAATEEYNGFVCEVKGGKKYRFIGLPKLYNKISCYSAKPEIGKNSNIFLGAADVNENNEFVALNGTKYVCTSAIILTDNLNTDDDYLFELSSKYDDIEKIENHDNNINGLKNAWSYIQYKAVENLEPLEYADSYNTTQTAIFINIKKSFKAQKIDTILYRNIIGSFKFWFVEVNEYNVVTKLDILANVESNVNEGIGYVSIPYTELKENQYIGISGNFMYTPSAANGFSYCSITGLGDTLSYFQENGAIAFKEVCFVEIIDKITTNIKLTDSLIDTALLNGKKYSVTSYNNSKYIDKFGKNDIIAIKINSFSENIKNIGLFTSKSWNFPVIWQINTDNLIIDKWYFIHIKEVSSDIDLYLNTFEYSEGQVVNAEIINLTSVKKEKEEKSVVLFNKTFDENADYTFTGFTESNFTKDGLKVDSSIIKLNKYYSLSSRTVRYLCKFGIDTIAKFYTDTNDTNIIIDINNKNVSINNMQYECNCLEPNSFILIEISKIYNKIVVNISNLNSSEEKTVELTYSGPGGVGAGAVSQESNVIGMQHDYYCFTKLSGSDFIIKQMSVVSLYANLKLLIYGDSITEPEGYFPSSDYKNSWTQLTIANVNGHAISSGRGGTTIYHLMNRIVNELPFIGAEYVMITIGTNGGNTEENLSELIEYIISQGSIPILNNIPCNESGTQISVNSLIEKIRKKYNINGCKFDLATSVNMDGVTVDKTKMWWENYSSTYNVYHHPNVKGSKAMFARLKIDVPEIF